jgi:hypothetical protein
MNRKKEDFSHADLAKLLARPETRALLDRLRTMDPGTLEQAARQAMAGNTAQAQSLLSPLMADPQVQKLTGQVRDSYGGV